MTKVRARGEEIRRFILEHLDANPREIGRLASAKFQISRQAINKHLQRLAHEGSVTEEGKTRNRLYKLAAKLEWQKKFEINSSLEEDIAWEKEVSVVLGNLPDNVLTIWQFVFTEMLNNARDHSEGTALSVAVRKTAVTTEVAIADNGVGIFKKIQASLDLREEKHAVFELVKGKLTTDPERHTGEGIFFSSRMVDSFNIFSGGVYFNHDFGTDEDWIFERTKPQDGTVVYMKMNNHTARTQQKIFDQYTSSPEDIGFTKTVVPLRMAQYGNDKLISRSQAKRVLSRIDLFRTVIFDFTGVPLIGQGFADEMFRVFANQHPEINLVPHKANTAVKRMIERARSNLIPPDDAPNQLVIPLAAAD
jgi:DNA-binding transcriptional ArsR family regulator